MSERILVMRGGALGDFILGLPALHLLRASYPDAHLELIAPAPVLLLVAHLVDAATPIERSEMAAFFGDAMLPGDLSERYHGLDLAVIWLADPDGATRRHFERLGARSILQAPALPPKDGSVHATDHLLSTLAPLGTDLPHGLAVPAVRPSEGAVERASNLLETLTLSPTERLLVIHPGSGGHWKCWPSERFAQVAEVMADRGFSPFLLQGPADEESVQAVRRALRGEVLPVVSGLRIDDLAALLSLCAVYLGNDSGVTHLAAAVGVPTVALFGPTDPAVWAPRGGRVTIIRGDQGRLNNIAVNQVTGVLLQHDAAG